MARYSCRVNRIDQNGTFSDQVQSTELVPGDIIQVPEQHINANDDSSDE